MSKHSPLFEELILKSWWVILFLLLTVFAYDQAVQKRNRDEQQLRDKLSSLLKEKEEALMKQEELQLQLASQQDEAWIEMILMRRLGLVPEGQTKVYFKK